MRCLRVFTLLGVSLCALSTGFAAGQQPAVNKPVHLTFLVPEDSQVWVEGANTTMRGPVREFVSPALPPGQNYVYTVRVQYRQNGQMVDQKRDLTVKAGDYVELNYTGQANGAAPAVAYGQRNANYYYVPQVPEYSRGAARYGSYDRWHGILSYYGATPGWGTVDTTGIGQ
jgi:uncharacterized protein (TIGR03000 family)